MLLPATGNHRAATGDARDDADCTAVMARWAGDSRPSAGGPSRPMGILRVGPRPAAMGAGPEKCGGEMLDTTAAAAAAVVVAVVMPPDTAAAGALAAASDKQLLRCTRGASGSSDTPHPADRARCSGCEARPAVLRAARAAATEGGTGTTHHRKPSVGHGASMLRETTASEACVGSTGGR